MIAYNAVMMWLAQTDLLRKSYSPYHNRILRAQKCFAFLARLVGFANFSVYEHGTSHLANIIIANKIDFVIEKKRNKKSKNLQPLS